MKIKLGDKVKDEVSGFEGVAVARHEYLNGCFRISVQPAVGKDGKLPESATFDEPNIRLLKSAKVAVGRRDTGGPEKYTDNRPTGETWANHEL